MPRVSPILVLSKKRKISITDLSKHLHVSSKMLYKYMNRPYLFHVEHLITMAGIFEVKPRDLLDLLIINRSEDKRTDEEKEINLKDL